MALETRLIAGAALRARVDLAARLRDFPIYWCLIVPRAGELHGTLVERRTLSKPVKTLRRKWQTHARRWEICQPASHRTMALGISAPLWR